MEKSGNVLFKYRGQFPLVLFLSAIPVLYFTESIDIQSNKYIFWSLTGLCIFISFVGQYIRGNAIGKSSKNTSGRNTKEQVAEALNTKGIYSTCRHPLYLGNYFMWIGIVMYTFNIWFIIIVTAAFWLYYERIMFAEERFLERKFGDDYVNWSLKVPAFIPSFKNHIPTEIKFSMKTILRREYSGVTATIIGFVFIDIVRDLFHQRPYEFNWAYLIVIGVALLISLVLRTLKHKTKILFEEDRS